MPGDAQLPPARPSWATKPPKDYDPDRRWGSKVFTKDNVPDEVLRSELTLLQELSVAIRAAVDAEKMPPQELANRAGVTLKTVYGIQRGEAPPTWSTVVAITTVKTVLIDPVLMRGSASSLQRFAEDGD